MPRRRRPWTKKRKLRQEGLFSIKSILGERLVDGNVQYLLNWEDDPETGEVYDNTWEPAEFVTAPAIAEWEAQKPPASSEDSQPPRPANWRQLQRAQSNNRERSQEQVREPSSSLPELPGRDEEPARKKRRLDFATSPSQEPVPSITSSTSFPSATSDIPEDIQPPRTEASRLFVQLRQVPDSFAADYQSVADTQSTPYSSQTIGELEARDERIALVEDSSQKTIPDSQETSNPDLIEDYNQATAQSVRTPPPDVAPDFQSRTCEQSKPDEAVDSQPESSTSSAPKEPIPDEAFDSQPQSLVLPETAASSTSGASEEAASDEAINSESQSLVVPPETFENSTSSASKEVVLDETLNSQSQSLVPPETSEDSTFTAPEDFVPDEALDSQPQSLVRPETVENSASSAPEEVVPDSADVHPDDVNTDIPSRQPNQLDFHDHPGQELAEVTRSEGEQVDKAATNNNDSQEVSQPVFLTQPNFQEPNLGSSSSQAQFQTPVATRSERPISSEQPETKYNPPRRALPEYSPGILISLCQESDDAMFGTERDEEPRSRDRPSLLAEVRALWDDEPSIPIQPAEQKRSSPSHPALQPESMPLASSYHTVAGASPSQHRQPDFLSRPPVETQSWTAGLTDMSGPGSRPVASSESASEMMQKLLADTIAEPQPTTVSPADVSLPTEVERLTIPVYSSHEAVVPGLYGSSGNSIALGQVSEADKGVTPKSSSDLEELDSHMVTLPLQASLRNLYDEILLKHKYEVTQFGDAFSTEVFTEPDQSLTSTIDSLFSQFHNLCDYPPNALESPLEGVPTAQKVRYYMDSNAKLHFLYEFLHGITQDTAILIVARSPNLLRLMCEVAEALKLDCTCASLGYHAANTESFVRLTLSLSSNNDEEPDSRQYDVIIGYDGPSSNSAKFRSLAQSAEKQSALVLNLIAAFSIEHIETEMPPVKTEMERKNALLIGIVNARSLIIDPPSLPKPPDVGRLFASYVNDRTKTIVWEPEPIPASVLDFYMNSQSLSQMPREKSLDSEGGGLKRKLDENEDAESKRVRLRNRNSVSANHLPPLPDPVQGLLAQIGYKHHNTIMTSPGDRQLSLPVKVLEALAEKFSEAQRVAAGAEDLKSRYDPRIQVLETQVKEHERSQEITYRRYRESVQDRTQFEAVARKAEVSLQSANDAAKRSEEKSQRRIAELEATIARLTEDSSINAKEKSLQEAAAKIEQLEKRLATAHQNEEYARKSYQDASSAASSMSADYNRLKESQEALEQRASDNLRSIHEIQAKSSAEDYRRQVAGLKTRLKEAHAELDRVREELRQIKNGRRETRQVSVPRSPRMGSMMSPRPRAAFGGPSSRGASPAPPIGAFDTAPVPQFTTPQRDARFAHLR